MFGYLSGFPLCWLERGAVPGGVAPRMYIFLININEVSGSIVALTALLAFGLYCSLWKKYLTKNMHVAFAY